MVTKAAKAATAVKKPISIFFPATAAPLLVGVVLTSEVVEDAPEDVGVAVVDTNLLVYVSVTHQSKTELLTM